MSVLDLLAVTYEDSFSGASSTTSGDTLASMGMFLVIALVLYLLVSFLLYKVFKKAGRPGWAAFVPIYNSWILFEISGAVLNSSRLCSSSPPKSKRDV